MVILASENMVNCCVPLCSASGPKCPGLSWHGFPRDEELKKKWIKRIRRAEGPNFKLSRITKVCSRHFKQEDFKPTCGRRMLKPTAVPSKFEWNNWGLTDQPPKKLPPVSLLPLVRKDVGLTRENHNRPLDSSLKSDDHVIVHNEIGTQDMDCGESSEEDDKSELEDLRITFESVPIRVVSNAALTPDCKQDDQSDCPLDMTVETFETESPQATLSPETVIEGSPCTNISEGTERENCMFRPRKKKLKKSPKEPSQFRRRKILAALDFSEKDDDLVQGQDSKKTDGLCLNDSKVSHQETCPNTSSGSRIASSIITNIARVVDSEKNTKTSSLWSLKPFLSAALKSNLLHITQRKTDFSSKFASAPNKLPHGMICHNGSSKTQFVPKFAKSRSSNVHSSQTPANKPIPVCSASNANQASCSSSTSTTIPGTDSQSSNLPCFASLLNTRSWPFPQSSPANDTAGDQGGANLQGNLNIPEKEGNTLPRLRCILESDKSLSSEIHRLQSKFSSSFLSAAMKSNILNLTQSKRDISSKESTPNKFLHGRICPSGSLNRQIQESAKSGSSSPHSSQTPAAKTIPLCSAPNANQASCSSSTSTTTSGTDDQSSNLPCFAILLNTQEWPPQPTFPGQKTAGDKGDTKFHGKLNVREKQGNSLKRLRYIIENEKSLCREIRSLKSKYPLSDHHLNVTPLQTVNFVTGTLDDDGLVEYELERGYIIKQSGS